MRNLLTLIIPSYRSKKLILTHLKNFSNKYKIIIIENSYDLEFEKFIKEKYPQVNIFLKKNIGYGRAVNFAAKKVKTKYFFVINPDTIIFNNTIKNLVLAAKSIKNFGAISPIYSHLKRKYKKNFTEVSKLVSAAMLIKTKTFLKIKGYDENYFLYYEDDDFFLKCNALNLKLFQINTSLIKHNKTKKKRETLDLHSTTFQNFDERNNTLAIGGWHGQWSKFYFFKKHQGYLIALLKCLPNNLLNFFQLLPYLFFKPSKAKYKYYKIEGFVCSVLGISSFKRSLYDIKNIY